MVNFFYHKHFFRIESIINGRLDFIGKWWTEMEWNQKVILRLAVDTVILNRANLVSSSSISWWCTVHHTKHHRNADLMVRWGSRIGGERKKTRRKGHRLVLLQKLPPQRDLPVFCGELSVILLRVRLGFITIAPASHQRAFYHYIAWVFPLLPSPYTNTYTREANALFHFSLPWSTPSFFFPPLKVAPSLVLSHTINELRGNKNWDSLPEKYIYYII